MNVENFLLRKEKITTQEAFEFYDDLSPVDIDFMLGRWKGREAITGHHWDGALELAGWYGKYFIDENNAHPLLFYSGKDKVFSVTPKKIFFSSTRDRELPKHKSLKYVVRLAKPFVQTKIGKARLRMVEYRGKSSTAMCYDEIPVHDCFRKIDDNRVLGAMDLKGESTTYFFILERDDSPIELSIPPIINERN